jgi:hypothetical protein
MAQRTSLRRMDAGNRKPAMQNQHRVQLAQRMHLLLLRHLGQGIDVGRLLGDARYARDVLLVSDALPEHGLRDLAARFRSADQDGGVSRPLSWAQDASGFGDSPPASAFHEVDLDIDLDAIDNPAPPRGRVWSKAARWFAAR